MNAEERSIWHMFKFQSIRIQDGGYLQSSRNKYRVSPRGIVTPDKVCARTRAIPKVEAQDAAKNFSTPSGVKGSVCRCNALQGHVWSGAADRIVDSETDNACMRRMGSCKDSQTRYIAEQLSQLATAPARRIEKRLLYAAD